MGGLWGPAGPSLPCLAAVCGGPGTYLPLGQGLFLLGLQLFCLHHLLSKVLHVLLQLQLWCTQTMECGGQWAPCMPHIQTVPSEAASTLNHPNGVQGIEICHPQPPNLSLWQKDYFELEAIKSQMQKDAFQELPLSDQKHLTGDSLCPRRRWQVGVKMNLHKKPLSFFTFSLSLSVYIYFCYHLNVCVPPTSKFIYGSPNS